MIAYIILGLTLACFLVLGLVFGLRHIRGKKQWDWPKGPRITHTLNGFTAHVIYDNLVNFELTMQEITRRGALAAWCLDQVLGGGIVAKEFTIHLLSDGEYDSQYDSFYGSKSNGMQLELKKKSGDVFMPLLVCRASKYGSTPLTGSLVIHELLHEALERTKFLDPQDPKDRDHSDKEVWGRTTESVEKRSQDLFVSKVGNLV
jgi:hypothetical protein